MDAKLLIAQVIQKNWQILSMGMESVNCFRFSDQIFKISLLFFTYFWSINERIVYTRIYKQLITLILALFE